DLVADHVICEAEHPVEVGDDGWLGAGLDEDVVALPPMAQLVGEAPFPPPVDPHDLAAPGTDQLGRPVDDRPDAVLLQAGVDDDHDFVWPHGPSPPSGPAVSRTAGPPSAGGRVCSRTGSSYPTSAIHPSPLSMPGGWDSNGGASVRRRQAAAKRKTIASYPPRSYRPIRPRRCWASVSARSAQ